jgi:hypothetical protein
MIISVNSDISLNSVNKLMFVMVTGCVPFAVRPQFLYITVTIFRFKGLTALQCFGYARRR